MSSHGNCTGIPANPDVAGIGIRLSIYITTVIISLIRDAEETKELRDTLLTAAGLNGFSLLVTALIETANRSLTLYHAILIIHLLTFLGIATNPTGSYRPTGPRIVLYWITTWMVLVLLLCWTMYVWVTAPTFGPPGACNGATIYVLLFVNVRATVGWLRWLFFAADAVALFAFVCMPILVIMGLWIPRSQQAVADERAGSSSMVVVQVGGADLELQRRGDPLNITAPRAQSVAGAAHPQRAFTSLSNVSDHMLYFFPQTAGRGRFLASVYGITMLELTIHRNKKHVTGDENQWAFGQIAAMVITAGCLKEVLHSLMPGQNLREKETGFFDVFPLEGVRGQQRL